MKISYRIFLGLIVALLWSCNTHYESTVHTPQEKVPEASKKETIEQQLLVYDEEDDALEPLDEAPLFRLAVIADMNGNYGSAEYSSELVSAIDFIIEERPDMVINAGDMVAGQRAKLNYRKMWASFHETVTDRLLEAGIPMAQTPGNHDASAYPRFANEREIYIDEWSSRKPELDYVDDSQYPLYYAFEFKGVLFISLDATTLDPLDDDQYAWLEKQLVANNDVKPVLVFGHVPLYPVTTIKPTEILRDSRIKPLFEKWKVKLFITGHQHAYFPSHSNGVHYLHAGALGGGPRPLRFNSGFNPKTLSFVTFYRHAAPRYQTFTVSSNKVEPLKKYKLPTYLRLPSSILARYDIKEEEAEFAQQHWISPQLSRQQMRQLISAYKNYGLGLQKLPHWGIDKEAMQSSKPPKTPHNPELRVLMR